MLYIEEVKKILSNMDNLKEALKSLDYQIEEIECKLDGYRGLSYEGLPGGKGKKLDTRRESLILERDNLKDKLHRTNETVLFIEHFLDQLQEQERHILTALFIHGKKLNDLSRELRLSRSKVHRIKEKALHTLAVKYYGIDAI